VAASLLICRLPLNQRYRLLGFTLGMRGRRRPPMISISVQKQEEPSKGQLEGFMALVKQKKLPTTEMLQLLVKKFVALQN
jgi:hypothetical protein